MKNIKVKNTYDVALNGVPSLNVISVNPKNKVAVLPSTFPNVKPKLIRKMGEKIKLGEKLFVDKNNPDINFCSPASGEIVEIVYGPRRRLDAILIKQDESLDPIAFEEHSEESLNLTSREDLVKLLVESGIWPFFRAFPFKTIPKIAEVPPAIYVCIDNDEPFMPQSEILIDHFLPDLKLGLAAVKKIANNNLKLSCRKGNNKALDALSSMITHQLIGKYPANNPAVFLYHAKKNSSENKSWTINAFDIVRMGAFLRKGSYPSEILVSMGGSKSEKKCHIKTKEGVAIQDLIGSDLDAKSRYIAGGVLTGRNASNLPYLGFNDSALTIIEEGAEPEMLSFLRLGTEKPSKTATFFSSLTPEATFDMNSCLNGGKRSCIGCSICVDVCPVNIYPQLLVKSILADDHESSIRHGLLDCADCGLCTYVCPSKIELGQVIEDKKEQLAKEVLV